MKIFITLPVKHLKGLLLLFLICMFSSHFTDVQQLKSALFLDLVQTLDQCVHYQMLQLIETS